MEMETEMEMEREKERKAPIYEFQAEQAAPHGSPTSSYATL